jgi:Collagen triple helix repeat (20 copies)
VSDKEKIKAAVSKLRKRDPRVIAIRNMIALAKAKGTPGDTGKDGIDGMRGADGINGINGIDGLRGADGLHGAKGIDGSKGEIGAVGPQGDKGEAGMIWRGTYRSDIEYWIGDVVGVSGSAYVCVAATNQAPPVGFGWELLVSRGAQGIRGIKGEDGTGGGGAAAAGTLTGATLAANVVNSSLTSVGTLEFLTVTNIIGGSISGNAATATSASNALTANTATTATTATTAGTVTTAAQPTITSVGTLTAVNTSGVITGTNTTASTSSATGAVIIAGGAGIAKDSYINSVKAGIGFTGADASSATNTSFGNAASDAATGTSCTAIGNRSLRGNTANNVTGIGYFSADGNSGSGLCAFGGYAGYSNSGSNVTAFGYSAAYDCGGNFNVAVGDSVLSAGPCTGANNTGVGYRSARLITSGADNTCIGYVAGDLITTGTNNCVIGASANVAALGNTNSIVIGKSAVGLGSNTTVIGVAATTETKLFGQLTLNATACISAASATALALKTVVPAGTGVTPTIQVICPSSATALTSGATAQNAFSTLSTISVQAATTYMFDGVYIIKTTGATTHIISMSFALTTATITNCSWTTMSYALAAPPVTPIRAQDANFFADVAGGNVNTTNATAYNVVKFEGIMRINAAGNVVPQITFSAAPGGTNTMETGSYLRFYPIGANTIDSVGTAIS